MKKQLAAGVTLLVLPVFLVVMTAALLTGTATASACTVVRPAVHPTSSAPTSSAQTSSSAASAADCPGHGGEGTGGDIRRICDLFGLSVAGATRYLMTVEHAHLTTPGTWVPRT